MAESTPTLFDVKACTKCGRRKPSDAFPQGRNACRDCRDDFHRQYRERNRDKIRAASADHYRRNREKRIAQAAEYVKRNPPDRERSGQWRRAHEVRLRSAEDRCSVDDCGRPLRNLTLRLCSTHYRRRRTGAPLDVPVRTRRPVAQGSTCSREGCGDPHWARGLCRSHYRVLRHQENPEQGTESRRRRRVRLQKLPVEPYNLADILARDGTSCVLCGDELDLAARWPHPRSVTVDHLECLVWPGSPGDVLTNVGAAHLTCNVARSDRPHPAAARKRAELLNQPVTGGASTYKEPAGSYAQVKVYSLATGPS